MAKTTKMRYFALLSLFLLLSGCVSTPDDEAANQTWKQQDNSSVETVTHSIKTVPATISAGQTTAEEAVQPAETLWQRMFRQYALKGENHKRIVQEKNWYKRHPEYLARVQKRATPYLHLIVSEVEARGMPMELALLPIVESAFQPFAYSHGRAAGLWQFIPSTGRSFGLKQNWWYDGRRDVYASTQAALDYLNRLQKQFDGDWLLALAAYNSGGGTVRKAIRKNKQRGRPTDYWSLTLPRETRHYVPKLLAISELLANSEKYGVKLVDIPNRPQLARVNTGSQLDLALAAKMADLSVEDLYKLNPAFNRWSTDPKGPHYLLIPVEKKKYFEEQLSALAKSQRVKWVRHKIGQGDTLIRIANRYNTSVATIKQVNQLHGHSIRAGKHLLIPTSTQSLEQYSLSQPQRQLAALNANRKGNKTVHTVRSGDTLWDIARAHKVSSRAIAKWNNMAPGDVLKPGQKLAIWSKQKSIVKGPINPFRSVNYTVRSGDSLYLIAQKFNVSVTDLKRWNSSKLGKYLKPGQRLKVKVDITKPTV